MHVLYLIYCKMHSHALVSLVFQCQSQRLCTLSTSATTVNFPGWIIGSTRPNTCTICNHLADSEAFPCGAFPGHLTCVLIRAPLYNVDQPQTNTGQFSSKQFTSYAFDSNALKSGGWKIIYRPGCSCSSWIVLAYSCTISSHLNDKS